MKDQFPARLHIPELVFLLLKNLLLFLLPSAQYYFLFFFLTYKIGSPGVKKGEKVIFKESFEIKSRSHPGGGHIGKKPDEYILPVESFKK